MSSIQDISGLSNNLQELKKDQNLKKASRYEKVAKESASETSKTGSGKLHDTVSISDTGKSMLQRQERIEQFKESIKEVETLDREKLLQIHSKIADKFYDSPDVLSEVVDNVVQESPVPEEEKMEAESDVNLNDIRDKADKGFYNSDDVIEKVAEKILNPEY